MPKFHTDIRMGGTTAWDEEGEDFASLGDASTAARTVLFDLARDRLTEAATFILRATIRQDTRVLHSVTLTVRADVAG